MSTGVVSMSVPDVVGLQWCKDVAPLATDVIGDLLGSSNPDDVFRGVVHTYANEHRDCREPRGGSAGL
ncbi:MAG: hypothetical protein M3Q39_12130 [Actinomycetota bacterium]|nr:hypothetical protein [Actinomycetota bacterium]